jgi:hypothetical protein
MRNGSGWQLISGAGRGKGARSPALAMDELVTRQDGGGDWYGIC